MKELYQLIFNQIRKAVVITDGQTIIDANQAFLNLVKLSNRQELAAKPDYSTLMITNSATDRIIYTEIKDEEGSITAVELTTTLLDLENNLFLIEINPLGEKEYYREITMLAEHSREMFDCFPDAIVILNDDSLIIDLNNAFEELFGYKRNEAIGYDIDELVNKTEKRDEGRRLFQRVVNNERVTVNGERVTKAGETVYVSITGYPIDLDKNTRGNCIIYRDISKEVGKEQLLKEKEQFTDQLFNKSLYPIAILNRQEIILNVNPQFEKLFGYGKEELLGKNINDFIVPEQYRKQAEEYLKTIIKNRSMMDHTQRISKSGELIDVEAVGSPVTINGEIIGLFAMYRDKRVETQAQKDLNRERAYFKQLFDHSPDPSVLLDDLDRVVFINPAFEKLFGYNQEKAAGKYINDLIINNDYLDEAVAFSDMVIKKGKTLKIETKRSNCAGRNIEVEIIAFPVFLEGDRLGAYAIYRDITDRKAKEREINELVYRDSLTGIPNRLYAYESLAEKIEFALESNSKVALIYFDLDGFKKVNDTSGHKVGDLLLNKLAAKVSANFNGRMEVCRVGGDEFLAIIDQPNQTTVEDYTAELKSLFQKDFVVKGKGFRIGLSTGSAVYPDDGTDLDQLILKADSRMYLEKRINRIKRYPERKDTTIEELLKAEE